MQVQVHSEAEAEVQARALTESTQPATGSVEASTGSDNPGPDEASALRGASTKSCSRARADAATRSPTPRSVTCPVDTHTFRCDAIEVWGTS